MDDDYQLKCDLIEEIKLHPVIYDKANPNPYKRNVKEQEYDAIGVILGIDGE